MNKYFSVLLFAFLLITNVYAQDILPKPDKYYSVVDDASLLKVYERTALTQKLDNFKNQTTIELVVVIIKSLGKTTVEDYAINLFENWGVGQKVKNNGILLLIAINDRKMRIQTGYGIETIITDAEAANIIDNILIPYFKNGNYYEGLEISTNFMINEMRTGFDYRKYALKGYENLNKYNFNISPAANRKDSLNPKIVSTILFLGQLLLLIGLVRHSKRNAMIKRHEFLFTLGVVLNFFLLILYFCLNYDLDAGTEFYSRINMYSFNGFLIACSCYLLVLLPDTYGKVLAKVIKELVRLFSFLIIAFFVSLPVLYVTVEVFDLNSNIPLLISIIIVLVILYYFDRHGALSTGWGRGGSSGSGGGGSSYSGSSGGSYGGGSSGGGGASGSW